MSFTMTNGAQVQMFSCSEVNSLLPQLVAAPERARYAIVALLGDGCEPGLQAPCTSTGCQTISSRPVQRCGDQITFEVPDAGLGKLASHLVDAP